MAIFLQHGHGKSDKLETAKDEAGVQGVILAPRNEKPENLPLVVANAVRLGYETLVDPQFYVSAFTPANAKYLTSYEYYKAPLSAGDFALRRVRQFASGVLAHQMGLEVTRILSPTVAFSSFNDRWCQIALNLADASLEEFTNDKRPLYLSFILSEEALSSEKEVDRFLDTITQDGWENEGFYFIVERTEPGYSQCFNPDYLANLMYLTYALSHINGYKVVFGYCDFVGLLLRAAGAEAIASGWSHTLRQFSKKSFLERPKGGQPPRERYSSSELLNSVFFSEAQLIFDEGEFPTIASDVALDPTFDPGEPWSQVRAQLQHWQTLVQLDEMLRGKPRLDISTVLRLVKDAVTTYKTLELKGYTFERASDARHLADWH